MTAINPTGATINILNPTAADGQYVRTEYAYIREYVKKLHAEDDDDVDLYVHLGQADGWRSLSVERRAFRQGMTSTWWSAREKKGYYRIADNAGRTVEDAGPCPWDAVPIGLETVLSVDDVVEGAQVLQATRRTFGLSNTTPQQSSQHGNSTSSGNVQVPSSTLDVKAHHEGGPYACGFIHYESLANCYVNSREPRVLFCHVPAETDTPSLEAGRDAVLAVIVSAVNQLTQMMFRPTPGPYASAVHP